MTPRRTGWHALIEWGLAVGAVFFALVTSWSIGLFVMPLALGACWLAVRRNRSWPEGPMGSSIGIGGVCLIIAYLNRHSAPCSAGPVTLGPGERFSCGGFDPVPWLAAGAVVVAAGLLGYIFFRRMAVTSPRKS